MRSETTVSSFFLLVIFVAIGFSQSSLADCRFSSTSDQFTAFTADQGGLNLNAALIELTSDSQNGRIATPAVQPSLAIEKVVIFHTTDDVFPQATNLRTAQIDNAQANATLRLDNGSSITIALTGFLHQIKTPRDLSGIYVNAGNQSTAFYLFCN